MRSATRQRTVRPSTFSTVTTGLVAGTGLGVGVTSGIRSPIDSLSLRERDVLQLVVEGRADRADAGPAGGTGQP
mgnify:CR=1 FL=1